ncbi:MAG TPA: hypothetical protein VLE22_12275, partial [Bryobacteraceae bacterium]|nr:hypothetical protein [Bryobacteraceae bacterium]
MQVILTVVDRDLSTSSWPGLSRPSTLIPFNKQGVDARDKRGHDESEFTAVGITCRLRRASPSTHRAP